MKGSRFGRLLVLEYESWKRVKVVCDCGKEKYVQAGALKRGVTSSCGCLRAQSLSKRRFKHGLTDSREYKSWCHMKDRCMNPNTVGYKYWGGRGIKICKRWLESFENFYADMGASPLGCSLDRIDCNGDYEPSNCRWATRKEQSSNTRRNVFLTHAGKTQTVAEWALEVGLKCATLRRRLRVGEPPEIALRPQLHEGKRII